MSTTRPNILWICTDQQRYDTIHALGNERIRTPSLDRLVVEGAAFTKAYAQSPICTPSRACFLTGRYPSTLHVNRNGNAYFPGNIRLITRVLADGGYDCGLVGKLHLSAADGRVEVRPDDGYRVFKWSHHPKPESFWPTDNHAYQRWLREQGVDWDKVYDAETASGWEVQASYSAGIETGTPASQKGKQFRPS
jgi:arylsulfatase